MSNIPNLRERLLSNTGLVLNGGKLYFYAAGTTTPQATYPTKADATALTNANANPVVAASTGMFGEIWLLVDVSYKVVLKDSSDNTIFSVDNVYALADDNTFSGLWAIADTPNHYGAVGDGVADESSDVQAAIDAVHNAGRDGVVDLCGRTYRCDSAITGYAGITIKNGTLNFTNCTASQYIIFQGTAAATTLLTSNAAPRDTSWAVTSASGLATGDIVFVAENSGSGDLQGEMARLMNVSGTTVYPAGGVAGTYTTAGGATLREIGPLEEIRLRDLQIISSPAASGTGRVLHLERCHRAIVENCVFSGHKDAAIEIRGCYSAAIVGCTIEQSGNSTNATQVGIRIADSSRDITVRDCTFTGQNAAALPAIYIGGDTAATATPGYVIGITIDGCSFEYAGGEAAIVVDPQSKFVLIDDCIFASTETPSYHVHIKGCDTTVSDCSFRGPLGTSAIYMTLTSARLESCRVRIKDNTFDCAVPCVDSAINLTVTHLEISGNNDSDTGSSSYGGVRVKSSNTSALIYNIVISGNSFGSPSENGRVLVSMASGGTLARAAICNNTAPAIEVDGNASAYATDVSIIGNTLNDGTASGKAIYVVKANRSTINGNTITGSDLLNGVYVANAAESSTSTAISGNTIGGTWHASSSMIQVDDTDDVTVSGNTCVGGAINGIAVQSSAVASKSIAISGNSVSGINSAATSSGIYVNGAGAGTNVQYVTISGNSVKSAGRACKINGYVSSGTISGNIFEAGAAINSVLYLVGGATDSIANICITGNTISEGVYGIESSNTLNITSQGNNFYSQSTGITSGNVHDFTVYETIVNITATEIVGNAAGDLGGTGVTLVPAVADKAIHVLSCVVNYTFATAAYTGGGADTLYDGSGIAFVTTANLFTTAGNIKHGYARDDAASGTLAITNTAVVLQSGAAYTQPGTAAGTAKITTRYILLDI